MPTVLVVYYSRTGNTKRLVDGFVDGVRRVEGVDAVVRDAHEAKVEDLLNADAIVFASPSYFRLPAWQLKKYIDESIEVYGKLGEKLGGALCTAGSEIGAVKCIQALRDVIEEHGMIFVGNGVWCIETPSREDVEKATRYGEEIAEKLRQILR